MVKEVGIWIDHSKAVIVAIQNKMELTREVESQRPQGSTAEGIRDPKSADQLNQYYEEIISIIRDADSIWIFGPGQAKAELENRLRKSELGARVVGIETASKMTYAQIAAKIRTHYHRK